MASISLNEIFEHILNYPDIDAQERFNRLMGLDDKKNSLSKLLGAMINPLGVKNWINKYYPNATNVLETILRRPPLIVLSGDVGSGKTELAETIGDLVARQEKIEITLLPLSLSTRGQGRVGEMTQLISAAFDYTIEEAKKLKSSSDKNRGGIILLIDEADALAQSRESNQMHHEDKAGVNAFIRGIDRIASSKVPVVVIMCTNRLDAIDPAIRRRSADIIKFERPNEEQRKYVLELNLKPLGFSDQQIDELVEATGPKNKDSIGYSFSDITQRLLPAIIFESYPSRSINTSDAINIAKRIIPTPQFKDGA
ncbi:AAA family ATPase [Frischella perrara]|uniref:AAA family ATPase n=1 Tax=Frischella perrara TaxID=1267021 RepID=UPI0023F2621E|nr:AAA family ATPase [Frischella perrara]MCT6876412.1 AAA family ATPase [Frischella perrara]